VEYTSVGIHRYGEAIIMLLEWAGVFHGFIVAKVPSCGTSSYGSAGFIHEVKLHAIRLGRVLANN